MALTPTNANDTFIREVDDAVREDQLRTFWDRYGKLLLGVIVAGLIGYGGWLFYNHNRGQNAGVTAEALLRAMDESESGDPAAAKSLATVKAEGDDAYRAAALMIEANNAIVKNDHKQAATVLGQLATDAKAPQIYRDLALVRQMTLQFDTIPAEEVIAKLKPIAVETNPVFPSAAELVALAYVKQGKDKDATALYGKIAAFAGTPEGLKSRSQQMAGMLAGSSAPATDTGAKTANDNPTAPAANQKAASGEAK